MKTPMVMTSLRWDEGMEQSLILSPLQLRQLLFKRVSIEALYPVEEAQSHWAPSFDFTDTEIHLNVELGEREPTDPDKGFDYRMGVELQLLPSPAAANHAPYQIDIVAQAWLSFFDHNTTPERRRSIVEVNGASIVIGAIREEIARITARSALGTLTLPTLRIIPGKQTEGPKP